MIWTVLEVFLRCLSMRLAAGVPECVGRGVGGRALLAYTYCSLTVVRRDADAHTALVSACPLVRGGGSRCLLPTWAQAARSAPSLREPARRALRLQPALLAPATAPAAADSAHVPRQRLPARILPTADRLCTASGRAGRSPGAGPGRHTAAWHRQSRVAASEAAAADAAAARGPARADVRRGHVLAGVRVPLTSSVTARG